MGALLLWLLMGIVTFGALEPSTAMTAIAGTPRVTAYDDGTGPPPPPPPPGPKDQG
jgi:hypothetical protein